MVITLELINGNENDWEILRNICENLFTEKEWTEDNKKSFHVCNTGMLTALLTGVGKPKKKRSFKFKIYSIWE